MARRYYRRRTIVVKPKKKWASNIASSNLSLNINAPQTPTSADGAVLVGNSAQSSNPTSTIIKAGNFKVQGDCYFTSTGSGLVQCVVYVMYVPQALPLATTADYTNLIQSHPEWIMAWKLVDLNSTSNQINAFTFSSRLKRNLNSGDTIRLIAVSEGTGTANFVITSKVQYWTTTA